MILKNLEQYALLVMILELIQLIYIQQTLNKSIWPSLLKNLKVRQNCNIILTLKKIKEYELNRVMALLKGREMVFKAFKSGIFAILKQSEQSEQSEQTSSNDKHTPSILLHQKLHQQLKYVK